MSLSYVNYYDGDVCGQFRNFAISHVALVALFALARGIIRLAPIKYVLSEMKLMRLIAL